MSPEATSNPAPQSLHLHAVAAQTGLHAQHAAWWAVQERCFEVSFSEKVFIARSDSTIIPKSASSLESKTIIVP
jgi:hypothetical protein